MRTINNNNVGTSLKRVSKAKTVKPTLCALVTLAAMTTIPQISAAKEGIYADLRVRYESVE